MRRRQFIMLLALPMLWCSSAVAQDIKNPADVLPENTLAYVELRQPGPFAKEIATLLQGSVLENVPDSFSKIRAKYPNLGFRSADAEFSAVGAAISSELVNELGRIKGAAAAITGIDKEERNIPEFVVIIMPGESNIPGFAYRMFAATFTNRYMSQGGKERIESRTTLEPIGETEGVSLYRPITRRTIYAVGADGRPGEVKGEPTVKPDGPAFARLASGVILIGTPDRVKDVIRRAKSTNKTEASLTSSAAYQKASQQLGNRPGLFAYGNPSAAVRLAEEMMAPAIRDIFTTVKNQINASAFTGVAASLGIDDGTAKFRFQIGLDPNEKTPILDLFASKPINPEVFQFAPKDALFVAAMSNADGEARWDRLVQQVDRAAKSYFPNVPAPSGMLAGMEAMLGQKIGKDLLGKIDTVAIAMAKPADNSSITSPPIVLIARLTDEEAATTFAKQSIPKLARLATFPAMVNPVEKKVGEQTLNELALGKSGPTIFYARQGATLVLGLDSTQVTDALAAGAKKQGFLSSDKAAPALRRAGEPVMCLVTSPLAIAMAVLHEQDRPIRPPATAPDAAAPSVRKVPNEIYEGLQKLSKLEDPLVVSLSRKPDQLLFEATYSGLKQFVPAAVDFGVETYFKSQSNPAPARP